MSPRPVDPSVRMALIEQAARLLREGGDAALTTRAVASAVGTSTMAVYTHFGGMAELRRAMRIEGFTRLARWQESVRESDDPVADLTAHGAVYLANALENPDLYRAMFGEDSADEEERAICHATFDPVVATSARCIEAGRFTAGDARMVAMQLWAVTHGMVSLHLASLWTQEELVTHLAASGQALYIGFGDHADAAAASISAGAAVLPPAFERDFAL